MSVLIEQSVIGCILADDVIALEACHRIGVIDAWFTTAGTRTAWASIVEMKSLGKSISPFILWEYTRPKHKDLLSVSATCPWVDMAGTAAHAQYHAELLQKEYRRREAISISKTLATGISEGVEPEEAIAQAQSSLNELNSQPESTKRVDEIYVEIVDRYDAAANKQGVGLLSPWAALNGRLNGWQGGEGPYVIAARPGCGKSTLMTNDAKFQALSGRAASISSQEMSELKLRARMICDDCDLNTFSMDLGNATPMHLESIKRKAKESHISMPLRICERPQTIEQFSAWATNEILRHGAKIIYLDYLQILLPSKRHDSRNAEVSAWMRAIRQLDKQFKTVPFVILSQLNRGDNSSRKERPNLRDLRDSGSIEQDAAGVIFIHEKVSEAGDFTHEIGVEKNRFGPQGWEPIIFNKSRQRFEDARKQ